MAVLPHVLVLSRMKPMHQVVPVGRVASIEDEDPETLRAIIDTCRDLEDRAEGALASWGTVVDTRVWRWDIRLVHWPPLP